MTAMTPTNGAGMALNPSTEATGVKGKATPTIIEQMVAMASARDGGELTNGRRVRTTRTMRHFISLDVGAELLRIQLEIVG